MIIMKYVACGTRDRLSSEIISEMSSLCHPSFYNLSVCHAEESACRSRTPGLEGGGKLKKLYLMM